MAASPEKPFEKITREQLIAEARALTRREKTVARKAIAFCEANSASYVAELIEQWLTAFEWPRALPKGASLLRFQTLPQALDALDAAQKAWDQRTKQKNRQRAAKPSSSLS